MRLGTTIGKALYVAAALCAAAALTAQDNVPPGGASRASDVSIGADIGQRGHDFVFGLQFTSPFIADTVAFRVSGDAALRSGTFAGEEDESWMPYGIVRLGVLGGGMAVAKGVRLYGEGGALLVISNPEFASETVTFGGYGHFGFEFFIGSEEQGILNSYFVEVGSSGCAATADLMNGKPLYLNGFAVQAGFRMYL